MGAGSYGRHAPDRRERVGRRRRSVGEVGGVCRSHERVFGEGREAGGGVARGPRRVHRLHPRFQSRLRVVRVEALRGHQKRLVGVADRAVPQGHAAPDEFGAALHRTGGRAFPGGRQQPPRLAGMSRQPGVVRRGGEACGTGILVGGEFRGPGQGGRAFHAGRRRAGSGRLGEAGREDGVGPLGGQSEVEQVAQAKAVGVDDRGEQGVGGPALRGRRAGVYGPAEQGAREGDAVPVVVHQPRRLGGVQRGRVQSGLAGGAQDQGGIRARRVGIGLLRGRRQEQDLPGGGRQRGEAAPEGGPQGAAVHERAGQRPTATELIRRQALGEGRQDGGIPFGLGQQLRTHGGIQESTGEITEEGGRRAVVQRAETDHGPSPELGLLRPVFRQREQEADRAPGVGVPRGGAENGPRGRVPQVHVVHADEQRLSPGEEPAEQLGEFVRPARSESGPRRRHPPHLGRLAQQRAHAAVRPGVAGEGPGAQDGPERELPGGPRQQGAPAQSRLRHEQQRPAVPGPEPGRQGCRSRQFSRPAVNPARTLHGRLSGHAGEVTAV